MPSNEEIYKGRKIVIPETLAPVNPVILIDNQSIEVTPLRQGTYLTDLFAFKEFGSLHELARTLIDQMPER